MKRFLTLALILTMLSGFASTALANGLLISPAPQKSEEQQLLESLHKGIIPITPDMTYDDFLVFMSIVDNSQDRLYTAKFETFVALIEYYHYGGLTADEIFSGFAQRVTQVDINNMEQAYVALFASLDKFSYYLNDRQSESFFAPTSSKGIGIKMIWRDASDTAVAGIYVDEVADGSPAQSAGIAVGDRIVGFDGYDLDGLGFEALSTYLALIDTQAPTLQVKLDREGVETEYTLERTTNLFDEHTVTLYPEKNLIYLDINSFMYQATAYEVASAIDEAWKKGYTNIIVDLQDNSGGDIYVASNILSKFTSQRELLFFMGRDGKISSVPFISYANGYDFDNVSVLVNGSTASSAEIFADTLRKIADAQIIGSQTYGKGVAQSVFSFEDGATVGITTYVAYDKYGDTYNEVGIIPDSFVTGKVQRNTLPSKMPTFTYLNYNKAVEGAENSTVKGLEMRLEVIGFLSEAEVDGKWTDATTRALSAFQRACGFEVTGKLDDNTYFAIIDFVRAYESTYSYTYTLFDYAYRFIPYK